jgi:hypothetical protein
MNNSTENNKYKQSSANKRVNEGKNYKTSHAFV